MTQQLEEAILGLYAELDRAVADDGPVCELSGRCCRFAEYGHTLFVSAPEVELLIERAPPPVRLLDDGATCPWQNAQGHCTARDARPLGCRVYFCDPAYLERGAQIAEEFIGRFKRLFEFLGVPWDYRPLHVHLGRARDAGAITFPVQSASMPRPAGTSLPP